MTSRLTSFTTTHRVINRVHNYTTVVRTTTHPARATGLTRAFESVVRVSYTTYSSLASTKNLTSFTRRQLDNAVVTFTRSQLCEVTSRANQEGALSWTKLDVVDNRTDRDILQRKRVTYFRSGFSARHQLVANFQSIGSDNVTFFTISVKQESDTSRAVRIILNRLYDCWNTIFLTFEVDETELSLVAATQVAHCHFADIVATARCTLTVNERFFWYGCSNFFERTNNFVSLARCCGLKFTYCHLLFRYC